MNLQPTGFIHMNELVALKDGDLEMLIDAYHKHDAFRHLNEDVLPELKRELGLYESMCILRGIIERPRDTPLPIVWLQVITPRGKCVLKENWDVFPSETLKTKLLMVCA